MVSWDARCWRRCICRRDDGPLCADDSEGGRPTHGTPTVERQPGDGRYGRAPDNRLPWRGRGRLASPESSRGWLDSVLVVHAGRELQLPGRLDRSFTGAGRSEGPGGAGQHVGHLVPSVRAGDAVATGFTGGVPRARSRGAGHQRTRSQESGGGGRVADSRGLTFVNLKAEGDGPAFPSGLCIPQTFLIDRGGRLLANKPGDSNWASAPVKSIVQRLLEESVEPPQSRSDLKK